MRGPLLLAHGPGWDVGNEQIEERPLESWGRGPAKIPEARIASLPRGRAPLNVIDFRIATRRGSS